MKKKACFLVLLIYICFLNGCVKGFTIIVKDNGDRAPIFQLKSAGLISRLGVEIDSFNLYEFPGKGRDFIWGIESLDKKTHLIEEVKYGVVPDGFREINPPRPLFSGGHYVAGSIMAGKMSWTDFILK